MNNNGVGFVVGNTSLVFNGDGAPWATGWYDKIIHCHRKNYKDWSYVTKKELPTVTILLEGLIRWEDE